MRDFRRLLAAKTLAGHLSQGRSACHRFLVIRVATELADTAAVSTSTTINRRLGFRTRPRFSKRDHNAHSGRFRPTFGVTLREVHEHLRHRAGRRYAVAAYRDVPQ